MGYLDIITGVLVPAVLWALGWAGKLQKSVSDLRIHVAEQYTSQSAMKEVVEPLRREINSMRGVLYQIAAKLNINAHRGRDDE